MLQKTTIIVNPCAAKGRTKLEFEHAMAEISINLREPIILMTEGPGHATRLTRKAIEQGVSCIIVVGGDGTINEVVNGFFDDQQKLINPEVMLGILPSGMGNDFVKNLGWVKGIKTNIRRLLSGNIKHVDVGLLTCIDQEGCTVKRYFLNASSVGISGKIVEKTTRAKKFLYGSLTYYMETVKSLWSYQPKTIRIELDGKRTLCPDCTLIVYANGQYFGGGMRIAPRAQTDDGRLDQITVSNMGLLFFLRHGLKVYRGQHVHLPQVTTARGRMTFVDSQDSGDILVEADGDVVGRLPAKFEILSRRIKLLV